MPGYTVEASVHCGQLWLLLSWGRQSRDPMTLHSLQHLLSRDSIGGTSAPLLHELLSSASFSTSSIHCKVWFSLVLFRTAFPRAEQKSISYCE